MLPGAQMWIDKGNELDDAHFALMALIAGRQALDKGHEIELNVSHSHGLQDLFDAFEGLYMMKTKVEVIQGDRLTFSRTVRSSWAQRVSRGLSRWIACCGPPTRSNIPGKISARTVRNSESFSPMSSLT